MGRILTCLGSNADKRRPYSCCSRLRHSPACAAQLTELRLAGPNPIHALTHFPQHCTLKALTICCKQGNGLATFRLAEAEPAALARLATVESLTLGVGGRRLGPGCSAGVASPSRILEH